MVMSTILLRRGEYENCSKRNDHSAQPGAWAQTEPSRQN
jgi:hypothetical protein